MTENPLVSIVVPVYKVERFLDRCVESLVNQSYENIEIILVDDGSPDSCGAMCDAWAEKDSRFVFSSGSNGAMPFIRMCICYGLTYVIQILALCLIIDAAGISDIVAPIVAVIITTPINYIMNKLNAFHDRHTQSS